jgi:hypothetical protein
MLKQATATDWNDKDKEIAPTCLGFINSDNIGLAQYELIHQYKKSDFPMSRLHWGQPKHFTWEIFFTPTWDPQATSQFLLFMNKSRIHWTSKQTTSFAI